MSDCLICPSWAPCKCEGGPSLAVIKPEAAPRETMRPVAVAAPAKRINIRQKGAGGEREIAKVLNSIIQKCMRAESFSALQVAQAETSVQRNQNQSAVGGNDLSHTFGMSIEVKRQEQLSINTWWKQTCVAAAPNNELPVLIYRQNNKAWNVVTLGSLHLPSDNGSAYGSFNARIEIDWASFQLWFEQWVLRKLRSGELPRGVTI